MLIRRAVDFSWGQEHGLGWGRNISLGGMFVESRERPAPGVNVSLTVRFRRAPTVSIPARVCRTQEGGFAVLFDALGPREQDTIRRVVDNH